ncbi:D-alanyl-D-alanine carboxypeptidase family protein [Microvirga sp. W0021]|uniref:serine-type D-Ala-D-Ala carboxypeptidase n=1 Tax=Hohaiivirga grylli TaxID=3133970 RepID=A0ABV0BIN9_9HYPH
MFYKKRGLFFFLMLLCTLCTIPSMAVPSVKDASTPNTTAPVFILMDASNGDILASKDAQQPFLSGDMNKLMTANVIFSVLKQGKITLDTEYPISEHAWQHGRGGSMFALVNSRIRVEDLLRGITVLSTDDGAIALAEGLTSGKEEAFVALMNNQAKLLGLRETFYINSTGSGDEPQYTTARDIAVLAFHLMRSYPEYYRLYKEKSFTWSKIEQLNKNPLLLLEPTANGLKSARKTTDGISLVGTAGQTDKQLIVVVAKMDDSHKAATEAQKILQWGFEHFTERSLFPEQEPIAFIKVYGGKERQVALVADKAVNILWQQGSAERISMRIDYKGPLVAPIQKNEAVGYLNVMKNGVLTVSFPVYTATDIAEGSLYAKATSAIEELSGRTFRGLWQKIVASIKKKQ